MLPKSLVRRRDKFIVESIYMRVRQRILYLRRIYNRLKNLTIWSLISLV